MPPPVGYQRTKAGGRDFCSKRRGWWTMERIYLPLRRASGFVAKSDKTMTDVSPGCSDGTVTFRAKLRGDTSGVINVAVGIGRASNIDLRDCFV